MASQDETSSGEALRALGWRQGSLLRAEVLSELLSDVGDASFALLLSQDCDIVRDEKTEPTLEVVPCRSLEKAKGNYLHGRNPRVFHIEADGEREALEIDIRQRRLVSKLDAAALNKRPVQPALDELTVLTVTRWVAKRYTRSAFPDEFNRRLKAAGRKLDMLAKKAIAKPVTSIYIGLEPHDEELDEDEDYELYVFVAYRDDSKKVQAQDFYEKLCDILDECDGLDLNRSESGAKSHFEISLADLEEMRRWDFDYRSIAGDADVVEADRGR